MRRGLRLTQALSLLPLLIFLKGDKMKTLEIKMSDEEYEHLVAFYDRHSEEWKETNTIEELARTALCDRIWMADGRANALYDRLMKNAAEKIKSRRKETKQHE